MRIVFGFLLIILVSFSHISLINAQKCYLEGKIINNENKEVSGFIDYRNWKYNPVIVSFMADVNETPRTFSPATLRSFSVNNEKFISAVVTIERTPHKFDELLISGERITSEEQVFLRVLVEGETALYYYNEKQSGKHFYMKKGAGGKIIELEQYSAITEIEGKNELVVKDEYKSQLVNLMYDCEIIIPLIHLADYTMEDLTEIVGEYNRCSGKDMYYVAELPSVEFYFVMSAGLSAFHVDFYGSGSYDLAAAEFPVSYRPSAAMGLEIVFPFARKAFSIYNELGISTFDNHDEIHWFNNEDDYENVEMDIGAIDVRLLSAVRYTLPARGLKPYIYAGMVNIYGFNIRNDKTSFIHFYTTETEITDLAIPEYRSYSQAFAAGIGVRYKNAGLDLRYELGNDITSSININSCTNIVFVQAVYTF
ncbi:MAG: hypothetical protein JW965_01425 [Bacteroidales bacterium]|nr:hypothetical protein [Bacteroidales bacterium]